MSVFWKGLLAFSLSMNLAGALVVGHHWLTEHRGGCGAGCQWGVESGELGAAPVGDVARAAEIEAMRRSFETFREGCHGDMRGLRRELVTELLSDEADEERLETILSAMGERQADLQRRLVEQILAERRVLSLAGREAFDDQLKRRLLAGPGCCPGRGPR